MGGTTRAFSQTTCISSHSHHIRTLEHQEFGGNVDTPHTTRLVISGKSSGEIQWPVRQHWPTTFELSTDEGRGWSWPDCGQLETIKRRPHKLQKRKRPQDVNSIKCSSTLSVWTFENSRNCGIQTDPLLEEAFANKSLQHPWCGSILIHSGRGGSLSSVLCSFFSSISHPVLFARSHFCIQHSACLLHTFSQFSFPSKLLP